MFYLLPLAAIPIPVVEEGTLRPIPPNPCTPNPCGPNSQCQAVSGQAECGCLSNMIGSAPNCRPECILNSDCPASSACVNQKCVDPCPGTCGSNSECRVVNHSPVCSCAAGFTGNAFNDCRPVPVVGKIKSIASHFSIFLANSFFKINTGIFLLLAKLLWRNAIFYLTKILFSLGRKFVFYFLFIGSGKDFWQLIMLTVFAIIVS